MIGAFQALLARIVREPAVILGVVVAAINTTQDQSWEGYGVAVATALLRFLVSPAYGPVESTSER